MELVYNGSLHRCVVTRQVVLKQPKRSQFQIQPFSPFMANVIESVDDKIKKTRLSRRMSYIVLCSTLVLVTVVSAVRALRIPGVYHALAVVDFTVICIAGWNLGARAIRARAEEARRLAVAGGLLIMPW